jgi:hypothetical protein
MSLALTLLSSCSSEKTKTETSNEVSRLAGPWVLSARVVDGQETPAAERSLKLVLNADGTFVGQFRGDEQQPWIKAGQGAFTYSPPLVQFYWDRGSVVTLLMLEEQPDRLVMHHGRNLVPLKDQEPIEVYVKGEAKKGPTRSGS